MRYSPVSELQPGMIIANAVIDNNRNSSILINGNVTLTSTMIKKLHILGYPAVYIYDNISAGIVAKESVPFSLRMNAVKKLKEFDLDGCMYLSGELIKGLCGEDGISTDMTNLASFDNYTYNHSINVASYAATLGMILGYNEEKVRNLALAGMLHDIGKTRIATNIINKSGVLTSEERKEIEAHPCLGYDLVKDSTSVSATVKVAIRHHHENEDGSGYPDKLTGDRIHEFAKIIHVCDVYDAMVSKRVYHDAMNPADVIEYLMGGCGTLFDAHIVNLFIKNLFPYPIGMLVWGSDDCRYIVAENNKINPLRPKLKSLDTGKELDMMQRLDFTIKDLATDPVPIVSQ